ncbi:dipeptide epimerase [Hydrogenimonas sp.]
MRARLAAWRLTRVRIPLQEPFVTALRRVEAAEALRLVLIDERGCIGIGEAPPTAAITGETLHSLESDLRDKLLPALPATPFTLAEALAGVRRSSAGPGARACLDIALHHLFARRSGLSLHRFLGASRPLALPTAVTVSLAGPDEMARQARSFAARGLRVLKLKLGGDGLDADRIETVRAVLPDATLLLDPNQSWRPEEAPELLRTAQKAGAALVEQPLRADDLAGMKRLTFQSPVPILADESAFGFEDVRRVVARKAAHMVNVKLMKCGGLAEGRRILRWCEEIGVECMVGSMLETPASIAAARALAAAHPKAVRYVDLDSPLLYRPL